MHIVVPTMYGVTEKVNCVFRGQLQHHFISCMLTYGCLVNLNDSKGHALQLMNAMCDLTQFIVSILVHEATS